MKTNKYNARADDFQPEYLEPFDWNSWQVPWFVKVLSSLIFVLVALWLFVSIPTAHAAVTVGKTGTDTTLSSTTQTAPGNVIEWVLQYGHTGQLGTMELIDPIPAGTQYVQGSLELPSEYTATFSTDGGSSYHAGDSGSVTHIKINGDAQPTTLSGTGESVSTALIEPPENFNGQSPSGDGTEAYFWGANIYNVNHHNNSGAWLQCHSKTGATCPGYPKAVSRDAGVAFGNFTHFNTPNQMWGGIDQATGRVYVPMSRFADAGAGVTAIDGILCLNLATEQSCGFTSLNIPFDTIAGGTMVNGRVYVIDALTNIYCFDINTNALCGAPWPMLGDPASPAEAEGAGGGGRDLHLTSYNTRYLFFNYQPKDAGGNENHLRRVGCVDLQTLPNPAICSAGFPAQYDMGVVTDHNTFTAPITDNAGNIIGICGSAIPIGGTSAPFECFNVPSGTQFGVDGSAPWEAYASANFPTNHVGSFEGFGSPLLIGARLYLPYADSGANQGQGRVLCWDFSANNICPVFNIASSGEVLTPYSLREDPYTPGCIWEVGDNGQFEVFDASLGGLSCFRTTGIAEAEPAAFYCGGGGGLGNWATAQVINIDPSDYVEANYTLYDANGNPIPGHIDQPLPSNGIIDISAFSTTNPAYSKLRIKVNFIGVSSNAWSGSIQNDPYVQMSWNGNDVQFCYDTTVLPCNNQPIGIVNNATFTTMDPATQTDMASATLGWTAASNCGPTPGLTVNKTASPTTGLAVGTSVTYTITSTNTGNVALTNVITTDPSITALGCIPAQPASLAIGDSVSCTGQRTVTQADVNAGVLHNEAQTCANPPSGPQICEPDDHDIPIPRVAQLTPSKARLSNFTDADGSGAISQGDTVNYQIVVTNTGNVTITNATTTDSRIASLSCSPAQPVPTLNPGDSFTCTGSLVVTAGDQAAGKVVNTATCTGTPPVGTTLAGCSTNHEEPVVSSSPGIQIIKNYMPVGSTDADNSGSVTAGDTLLYSLVIRNSGTQTLNNVVANDPLLGGLICAPTQPTSLAVGAQMNCTGTHVVSQAEQDSGRVVNIATAVGDGGGGSVNDDDEEIVDTAPSNPSISVLKTASPASGVPLGGTINYNILVTNNGNVTLTNVTVDDTLLSNLACTPAEGASLVPSDHMTCTGSHVVTQTDIDNGEVNNVATGHGVPPSGVGIQGQDDVTVPLTRVAHHTHDKVFTGFADNDGSGGPSTGDVLHYRLTVLNDGSVTLTNVAVTDTPALDNFNCDRSAPVTLVPGEILTCTGDHTVTQAEQNAGRAIDNVDSTAVPPPDVPPHDPPPKVLEVPLDPPRKSIGVDKSILSATDPDLSQDISPGDVVTYQIIATNTGNVTLTNMTVSDPSLSGFSCNPTIPTTRLPGQSITCTGTYTVTPADAPASGIGEHINTATAQGTAPDGTVVTGEDTERIQITPPVPDISVNKSVVSTQDVDGSGNITRGDVINYQIVASNTGNVLLNNVVVSDSRITSLACTPTIPTSLAPAASITCTGSLTVTQGDQDLGEVVNTARATGRAPSGEEVEDEDIEVQATAGRSPNATITKVIDGHTPDKRYQIGQIVNYTIVYTNTGNVTLTAVAITDDRIIMLGCDRLAPVNLAPGENITCQGAGPAFTQTDQDRGFVTNTATGVGNSELGLLVRQAQATAILDDQVVDLDTDKSHILRDSNRDNRGNAGEIISYTVITTNIGNSTVFGVVVTDTKVANLVCDKTLPVNLVPAEKVICSGEYTITPADVAAGKVLNVATGSGQGPKGQRVVDFDTANQDLTTELAGTGQNWRLALLSTAGLLTAGLASATAWQKWSSLRR